MSILWAATLVRTSLSDLVSDWELDETTGTTFVDTGQAGIDITATGDWADLSAPSLEQGDAGTAIRTAGTEYATIQGGIAQHNLSRLTLSFYYAPTTSLAKHILFCCGNSTTAGSFSIERLASGVLRGWHVDQDDLLQFFGGSTNGIPTAILTEGSAYRIDLSLGVQGLKLYLDGELIYARPESFNGWNNNVTKFIGRWTDGLQGPAVGTFDHIRLWGRQLSVEEIASLEASYSVGSPISIWDLDETSAGGGVFADSGSAAVDMDIHGTWTDLTTDPMVSGSTTSIYSGGGIGAGYATIPASQAAHDLDELTLSFYYQRDDDAAKHILFCCGDGLVAGDLSIEVLVNGRLRGWHVGGDGLLRFFEATGGVVGTDLQIGVAHRIDLTLGLLGARLYLDGVELTAAAIAANTNGWNNTRVKYLARWSDGVQAPVTGAFDYVRLWDRQLIPSEISLLEAAISVDLPNSVPPTPAAGFPRLTDGPGTLITTYKNLGTISASTIINLGVGGDAIYDLRGTGKIIDLANPPSNLTWNGVRCLYRCDGSNGGANHTALYVAGGWIRCTNMLPTYPWDSLYQSSNNPRAAIVSRNSSCPDANFDGFRADAAGWDVYSTGSGTTDTWPRTKITRCIWTRQRDDGLEDDNRCVDLLLEDSYVQAFACFSSDNTGPNYNSRTATINRCLLELWPGTLAGVFHAGPFFKLKSTAVRFRCLNSGFAVPNPAVVGTYNVDNRSIFRDLIAYGLLHPDSASNEIYWLGAGAFPYENPDATRFTVYTGTTAQTKYAARLAAIWEIFPGHRFDFDPDGPYDPGA